MIIVIPLGGVGIRFKENNYKQPKALINVLGRPILFYLLDNLEVDSDTIIYIPYNIEYELYNFESLLQNNYPKFNFKFFKLKNNTRGAMETIYLSLLELNVDDQPILCLDSDNFYTVDILKQWNKSNQVFVFYNMNDNPIYSFIKVDNNTVSDIVEKEQISNLACTGAYGFDSFKSFIEYSNEIINNNITQKNEFYISGLIRYMINKNIKFNYNIINEENWICLGTPLQVRQFINNVPMISSINNQSYIKKYRFCFDLDNTLVSYPQIKNDYTTVLPIERTIKIVRYLKKFGHTIIIYTARRMKTHNGNVGSSMADIGKITFDTLDKFKIPYDEIYFGKPYADYYIDDLAINTFDDIEKFIGFYNDKVKPRDFHQVSYGINTFNKKGNDLTGEIYYYLNIPNEIKDMFPFLIKYSMPNEMILEKINGLTVTQIYLSGLLKENTLIHIMNSIKRIQNCNIIGSDNTNIYLNYCNKLENRYNNFDYSKFNNSNIKYQQLYDFLKDYELNNKGRKTVIHGDPVLTNIFINNYGKIKFIDMRGKVGNDYSIYGDWLYDWAKLYQSLIGYDKILMDKEQDFLKLDSYEKKMIKSFEEYFILNYSIEDFNNLKIITKFLLFTLIPLHNNDKCFKYYDLINTLN